MERTERPSIIPSVTELAQSGESRPTRIARSLVQRALAGITQGELRLVERGHERVYGTRTAECPLSATVHVEHPSFYADIAFGGTVGAGESYVQGAWRTNDLTALVRIFVRNLAGMDGVDSSWSAAISRPLRALFHRLHRNSREGSARNIAAHYDLGNDFYSLWLDETMMYSCAIFEREDATLAEAQRAKLDALCTKLALAPGERLVEIGTGWGGLAVHAAKHYGCHVTTTTISREQHAYAVERVAREGLTGRVEVLLEDYRDLRGRYDKLVSIEMIEAVGADHLDTYFAKCSALLEPHGAMMLQAITIQDQRYAHALRNVDFIQRYVFPGAFIPSLTAIAESVCRATDLKIFHLEDIGPHYARTLRTWRERFFTRIAEVRQLGFPPAFERLWEYYLCYCEGGFAERQLGDLQVLFTKPHCQRASLTGAH